VEAPKRQAEKGKFRGGTNTVRDDRELKEVKG